jgi:hypothetical protein
MHLTVGEVHNVFQLCAVRERATFILFLKISTHPLHHILQVLALPSSSRLTAAHLQNFREEAEGHARSWESRMGRRCCVCYLNRSRRQGSSLGIALALPRMAEQEHAEDEWQPRRRQHREWRGHLLKRRGVHVWRRRGRRGTARAEERTGGLAGGSALGGDEGGKAPRQDVDFFDRNRVTTADLGRSRPATRSQAARLCCASKTVQLYFR